MGMFSSESDRSGLFLSDFGDVGLFVEETVVRVSSESDKNGLVLSDFEDGGRVWQRRLWGGLPWNRTKMG